MEILGYLITIASLQSRLYDTINDISIRTGEVKTLADDLAYEISRSVDINKLKKIEETGYTREGHIGKYYSKNVRDYFYYENISSEVEGIVITIDFQDTINLGKHSKKDDAVSIFLHKDITDEDTIVQDTIDAYLDQIDNRYGYIE